MAQHRSRCAAFCCSPGSLTPQCVPAARENWQGTEQAPLSQLGEQAAAVAPTAPAETSAVPPMDASGELPPQILQELQARALAAAAAAAGISASAAMAALPMMQENGMLAAGQPMAMGAPDPSMCTPVEPEDD
eukprot:1598978-Prymnesium_polylepis.1